MSPLSHSFTNDAAKFANTTDAKEPGERRGKFVNKKGNITISIFFPRPISFSLIVVLSPLMDNGALFYIFFLSRSRSIGNWKWYRIFLLCLLYLFTFPFPVLLGYFGLSPVPGRLLV